MRVLNYFPVSVLLKSEYRNETMSERTQVGGIWFLRFGRNEIKINRGALFY